MDAKEVMEQYKQNVDKATELLLNYFDGNKTHLEIERYGYGKYEYVPKLQLRLQTEESLNKRQVEKILELFPEAQFLAVSVSNSYGSVRMRIFLNPSK